MLNGEAVKNSPLYDMVLSDAFFTLSNHLQAGKIDPTSLTSEWKANRRRSNPVDLLVQAIEQRNVTEALNRMRPNKVRYFR